MRTIPRLQLNTATLNDLQSSGSSSKWFRRQSDGRWPSFCTQFDRMRQSFSRALMSSHEDDMLMLSFGDCSMSRTVD